MLCKLALRNVRRAGRDYLVYLLTLTLGVTVFYAFNTISMQVDVAGVPEEGLSELLGSILYNLTYFLAGVMAFLMVYANNFIMKRRKKEFGLYQVFGMGRGRVAVIMALETVFVSVAALVLGMVLGVILSQIMTFFTASVFKTQIANFHFFFSVLAFQLTLSCLAVTFVLTLLFNLRTVRRTKLIDLMGAGRRNETVKMRNPWLLTAVFLIGAVLIGMAYARLLHDGLPLTASSDAEAAEKLKQFGITTVMVTAGTFLLFYGLAGILIRIVQSIRGVYWRGLNMFTVRQLSAKINTVCLSMGVIAMILFLAITSVTCGMSIASVMNENLEKYNPVDASQTYVYNTEANDSVRNMEPDDVAFAVADKPVDLYARWKGTEVDFKTGKEKGKVDIAHVAGAHVQIDQYLSRSAADAKPSITLNDMCRKTGQKVPQGFEGSNSATIGLYVTPLSEYNATRKLMGYDAIDLGENGYVLTSDLGDNANTVYEMYLSQGKPVKLGGYMLEPKVDHVVEEAAAVANSDLGSNPGTLVVPDAVVDDLRLVPYTSNLLVNYKQGVKIERADAYVTNVVLDSITQDGKELGYWGTFITRTEMNTQAGMMNGLISYLAIYIGFVLVVACAAILAIQQLSGVADAGTRCRTLSELGCDMRQIRGSLLMQQAVFFLFPLAVGVAHAAVAMRVIIKLVSLFGHMSIGSMVGLTCAIFLAAYGGYFIVTYLMSRGIVNDAVRVRYTE